MEEGTTSILWHIDIGLSSKLELTNSITTGCVLI